MSLKQESTGLAMFNKEKNVQQFEVLFRFIVTQNSTFQYILNSTEWALWQYIMADTACDTCDDSILR